MRQGRGDADDAFLWDFYLLIQTFTVGQFALAVLGLGAMFFAYDQTTDEFLRVVISTVGVGASFILWMHAWGTRRDAHEVAKKIKKMRPSLGRAIDEFREWRWTGDGRFYLPVARMYVYFCGLLTLGWLSLLLYAFSIPSWVLYTLNGLGLVVAAGMWIALSSKAFGPWGGTQPGEENHPAPPSKTDSGVGRDDPTP